MENNLIQSLEAPAAEQVKIGGFNFPTDNVSVPRRKAAKN